MVHIIVVSSKAGYFAFLSRTGSPEVPPGLGAHPIFEVQAREEVEALTKARRRCARNEIDPRTIQWPRQLTTRS